ncbi:MAG: hypothetical protein AAF636_20815 [Pseudomonadota bacterium]
MVTSKNKTPWQPEDWWNRTFNWRLVRGFGQSAPATLSMSAPFIGYAVLYHAEIANWLGGLGGFLDQQNHSQSCQPWLSFSTRLNLLYCGILLLGFGTILYRIFTPDEVKSARSISDYALQNVDLVTARNLRSMFATIKSRRPEVVEGLLGSAPWLERDKTLKTASDGLKQDESNQIKIDVLRSYYNTLDRHTARRAVYWVVSFFALGLLLLSIPGFAFSARVLCTIGHDMGVL